MLNYCSKRDIGTQRAHKGCRRRDKTYRRPGRGTRTHARETKPLDVLDNEFRGLSVRQHDPRLNWFRSGRNRILPLFVAFDESSVIRTGLDHPLMLSQLQDVLTRERHLLQLTDFTFSRFLTPYLCDFEWWALFMDCDMLVLDDLAALWRLRDDA